MLKERMNVHIGKLIVLSEAGVQQICWCALFLGVLGIWQPSHNL